MELLTGGEYEQVACFLRIKMNPNLLKKEIKWRIGNQHKITTAKYIRKVPFVSSKFFVSPKYITIRGLYPTLANLLIESAIIRTLLKNDTHDGRSYQIKLKELFFDQKCKLLKEFYFEDYSLRMAVQGSGHSPFTLIDLEKDKHNITLKEYIKASAETKTQNHMDWCSSTYAKAIELYR